MRRMQIGHIVDFVIAYNERHEETETEEPKQSKPKMRMATQAEIDAFLG